MCQDRAKQGRQRIGVLSKNDGATKALRGGFAADRSSPNFRPGGRAL